MGHIYYNGDIITLSENEYPEGVYEKNGIIEYVGEISEIKKICDDKDEWVDLCGKTLCPAFIDPHSHITSLANTLRLCNLSKANCFDHIKNILEDFKIKRNIKKSEWIIGFGYDNNFLIEKKHPDKTVLDFFNENPVLITHTSGHMGVANSMALNMFSINENSENPEGGVIGRFENSKEPNGYLEETAFINISKNIPEPSFDEKIKLFKEAEKIYIQNGILTAQEGFATYSEADLLYKLSNDNLIDIDVVMYADMKSNSDIIKKYSDILKKYKNNLKLGGYKIFLDGSPQGKTAFMREPYKDSGDYRGYPVYNDYKVVEFFDKAVEENIQILGHSNGDGACQQFLDCYEKSVENKGEKDIRSVLIHGQLLGIDQLEKVKKLHVIPSYFVSHVYYWGDIHKMNFGIDRARNISPIKSTIDKNILFTMHTDTPVIMPNFIEEIWCAVNRITKNGEVLGESQRIDVYNALKGVTINAAYQYFEEDKKGSIEKGKYADFIVIDKNILKVDKRDIKNINVIKTIKRGSVLFDRNIQFDEQH